jgi:hypothetical protein
VRYNEINNVISKVFRVRSLLIVAGISIAAMTSDKANVTAGTLKERSHLVSGLDVTRKGKERKGKERKGKERKGKERKGKERKERTSNGIVIMHSERSVRIRLSQLLSK